MHALLDNENGFDFFSKHFFLFNQKLTGFFKKKVSFCMIQVMMMVSQIAKLTTAKRMAVYC